MESQEINDAANVVDPARAGSYKRVAEPRLFLSQLEDQGGECSYEVTRRTKKLATLSTVNSKLILLIQKQNLI
jgi:hypothetical protein